MLIGNYRANVETDFDLKNAQVILNYFVPESIMAVVPVRDIAFFPPGKIDERKEEGASVSCCKAVDRPPNI